MNVVDIATILFFGLIWFGACFYLRAKKNRSSVYLLFFTFFYLYLFKVLDYTLFQYQSLILMKLLGANLILNGQESENALNLVPLIGLTSEDVKTSLLNILLMVPWGFGLPFVTKLRMRGVLATGAAFSAAIELLQLTSGLLANITFRIADINDVIFNTAGAAAGYALFLGFMRLFRLTVSERMIASHAILKHISDSQQR